MGKWRVKVQWVQSSVWEDAVLEMDGNDHYII
jgi:hypothetical protein